MGQLPEPFAEDLEQWAANSRVPEITPRYFIPENGKKYVLEHDEDYCWSPSGEPEPDRDECQQMMADAADDLFLRFGLRLVLAAFGPSPSLPLSRGRYRLPFVVSPAPRQAGQ